MIYNKYSVERDKETERELGDIIRGGMCMNYECRYVIYYLHFCFDLLLVHLRIECKHGRLVCKVINRDTASRMEFVIDYQIK